jgi:2-dehydro-3-deoxygluconokinase
MIAAGAAEIRSYDFLTLGETLLRLSPPGVLRLDQARAFDVGIGGSELNVACLLARLGRRTAWVSRIPDGPLGRIVEGEARRHGVDTRFVRHIPNARLGLMFFESGPAPRNARVIYDRKHSAASEMAFEDAPWEALIAASARVHLSGITPALGPSCRALVAHVAQLAAGAHKKVSYDLNFRATLQSPADARAMLDAVAPHLELFVVAERDARAVLGFAEEAEALGAAIAARYGMPLVALTRGRSATGIDPGAPGSEPGDLLWARDGIRYAPRYPVEIVDRIGAGDSFVGGLIHGLLDGDPDLAIRLASYAAAVALATPGDINHFGPEDLAAFEEGATGGLVR